MTLLWIIIKSNKEIWINSINTIEDLYDKSLLITILLHKVSIYYNYFEYFLHIFFYLKVIQVSKLYYLSSFKLISSNKDKE